MRRIGLTGGIACGKSTASRVLQRAGATLLDADEIARDLVAPGTDSWRRIRDRFGPTSLLPDGSLDRAWLRRAVFSDAAQRQWLEALLHPQIRAEFLRRTQALEQQGVAPAVIVWVIPLLLEGGYDTLVDGILVIDCSRDHQWQRLRERSHWTDAEIAAVLARQADPARRRAAAHWIIANDGSEAELSERILAWWKGVQSA